MAGFRESESDVTNKLIDQSGKAQGASCSESSSQVLNFQANHGILIVPNHRAAPDARTAEFSVPWPPRGGSRPSV